MRCDAPAVLFSGLWPSAHCFLNPVPELFPGARLPGAPRQALDLVGSPAVGLGVYLAHRG